MKFDLMKFDLMIIPYLKHVASIKTEWINFLNASKVSNTIMKQLVKKVILSCC